VVIQHGRHKEEPSRTVEARRLAQARRLQVSADFEGAERLVREAIDAAPTSAEAWEALEYLKTAQGDFLGVAEVRQERLAQTGSTTEVEVSLTGGGQEGLTDEEEAYLRQLEARIAQEGEEGYWATRVVELQERQAEGDEVSPVLLARAFVGLNRTEEALRELEAAVEAKDRNLVSLWADPAWDSIRTDPRFRRILSKARGGGRRLPFLPQ
jgi:tetratricopeptide (TPR) repeat protein